MLEAFARITAISGKTMNYTYSDKHREGDHICYYSDAKMHSIAPNCPSQNHWISSRKSPRAGMPAESRL
jgi:hypothetical protein